MSITDIEDALLKLAVLNSGHLGLFLKLHGSEKRKVQFLINSNKVQFPIWYVCLATLLVKYFRLGKVEFCKWLLCT